MNSFLSNLKEQFFLFYKKVFLQYGC
ncbi:unknown protein [Parachlamydia acanthamoebae UV-7]|uniref:Uncharacterized protein n=1 Tax=Parachlamydia acanthamoebae (strain UV7) TaxID=765952 RepID=F8KV33_PARAV|nr:unknown protein [Parachlamydia acanthamoebae UV-7]